MAFVEGFLSTLGLFDWITPATQVSKGPVTAQVKVIGFVKEHSRQILKPGKDPGTREIVSSELFQSAIGIMGASAWGHGVARVAITGAMSGLADPGKGGSMAMVDANLVGMAYYEEHQTEFGNERRSGVMGSASVFARTLTGGTAQASIGPVTAMIGPAG